MNRFKLRGNKRIIGVVAVLFLLGISLVLVEFYGNKILSGFRGYIYGEGQWTKAQKQASADLLNLINDQNEKFYSDFQNHLQLNEGGLQAIQELLTDQPDVNVVYQRFLRGGIPPDNIDDMIWVFRNFKEVDLIQPALENWRDGVQKIEDFQNLAERVYEQIESDSLTAENARSFKSELMRIDSELTDLEVQFSSHMNDAATLTGNLTFWLTSIISLFFIVLAAYVSIRILQSLKKINTILADSQAKFTNVLNNSRDVIYEYKPGEDGYDYMSKSVEDMLGYSLDEVKNGGPRFILDRVHPDDLKRIQKELDEVNKIGQKQEKLLYDTEFRVRKADGEYIWLNNKRSPLKDENGKIVAVVGNVRDISEQKKNLGQIDQSLKEKQLLLSEIHHRVKNNLSIVASLIELQKERLSDPVKEQLQEIQLRIRSIALVHEKLYANESYSKIDMSQYIREMSQVIDKTYHHEVRDIEIVFDLEQIEMEIANAVTLGLILNEMMNNCYKHAFEDGESGSIEIELKKLNENKGFLKVSDSGGKLPENFNFSKQDSLGITLISTLANQLKGIFDVKGGERTEFSVSFQL